jgi:hypothetical protein
MVEQMPESLISAFSNRMLSREDCADFDKAITQLFENIPTEHIEDKQPTFVCAKCSIEEQLK